MGDSFSDSSKGREFNNSKNTGRQGFNNSRSQGNREGGGFRIRLSDNEMRASRAIQEAFNLRSTVAVLGFATRTLGQMLEDGKLDEIITEHRSNAQRGSGNRNSSTRASDRQGEHTEEGSKPNPFARPPKPDSPSNESTQEIDEGTNNKSNQIDGDNTEPSSDPNSDNLDEEQNTPTLTT